MPYCEIHDEVEYFAADVHATALAVAEQLNFPEMRVGVLQNKNKNGETILTLDVLFISPENRAKLFNGEFFEMLRDMFQYHRGRIGYRHVELDSESGTYQTIHSPYDDLVFRTEAIQRISPIPLRGV